MIVLGALGTLDRVDQNESVDTGVHDSSATLIKDGEIVAAIEEERFNRYKHSGRLPLGAIRYCLSAAGVRLRDVDRFVFGAQESTLDTIVAEMYRRRLVGGFSLGRPYLQRLLAREFGDRVDPARFEFVDHHYAHAASAFLPSGFDDSLVVTLDGMGEQLGGSVWLGEDRRLVHIRNYDGLPADTTQSLGHFYVAVTAFLGFKVFDEYKVMGLAPYGDPSRYRAIFDRLYTLKPDGDYEIYLSKLDALQEICPPRGRQDPVTPVHQDVAAALQEALERLVFHVLEFYKTETGARHLCLAGGVAHNCSANGKILRRGLFERTFVQPASHDGGLSFGAALHGYCNGNGRTASSCVMHHAYLGPSCGDEDEIERELARWQACIEYERVESITDRAAAMMAAGEILGWVQGRAEFGPRALGNRSIVADPRPAENKDIINAMIKKREAFRPFAPSVLEEYAGEYFELPPGDTELSYMVFVVPVRPQYRDLLGAITHVDGTARIQTVSRRSNPRYWALIEAFRRRTGVPILLNTSFNNNAEPIVTTTRDALVSFLTTDLHALVVGDFLVRRKAVNACVYADFKLSVPDYVAIHPPPEEEAAPVAARSDRPFYRQLFSRLYEGEHDTGHCLGTTHDSRRVGVSPEMAALLARADGFTSVRDLTDALDRSIADRLLGELLCLWSKRLVRLLPTSS